MAENTGRSRACFNGTWGAGQQQLQQIAQQMAQHNTTQHNTARHGTAQHSTAQRQSLP